MNLTEHEQAAIEPCLIHMAVAHKPDLERFQKRKPKVVARRRYSVETKEEVLADLKLGKTKRIK